MLKPRKHGVNLLLLWLRLVVPFNEVEMNIPPKMLDYFMRVENDKIMERGVQNPEEQFILPNKAPEDSKSLDIGFGHKITEQEMASGMINGMMFFNHSTKEYIPLTYTQAKAILAVDLARHRENAQRHLQQEVGWHQSEWDLLPEDGKWLFTGFSFNGAIDKFPKMTEAIRTRDYDTAVAESKRYWSDPSRDDLSKPLTMRNIWSETQLAKMWIGGYFNNAFAAKKREQEDLVNQV